MDKRRFILRTFSKLHAILHRKILSSVQYEAINQIFLQIDITKTCLPLADNSVDVIFHEDFLEHLSQRDQILFLAETLRVLKPSGIHHVNTPNLLSSMKANSTFR